jgi:hypothetical protein
MVDNKINKISSSFNKKDRYSHLDYHELAKIIKMLTTEIDGGRGLPIPRWSAKIMRQFIRFCYRNLKEEYIAKIEIINSFNNKNEIAR